MKKSIIYALAASALVLTGCDDFLDKDMRSGFTNNPAFWNNADPSVHRSTLLGRRQYQS